jgi:hypothetical protein
MEGLSWDVPDTVTLSSTWRDCPAPSHVNTWRDCPVGILRTPRIPNPGTVLFEILWILPVENIIILESRTSMFCRMIG